MSETLSAPDKPGVWAWEWDDDQYDVLVVRNPSLAQWQDRGGRWQYIGPLPEFPPAEWLLARGGCVSVRNLSVWPQFHLFG